MSELETIKLWTEGHSTRPIDEFIAILKSFELKNLVDVRTYPGSRRYPQFNKEQLHTSLSGVGIEYFHMPELGGRRRARPDSQNVAWRNEMFRGYADFLDSPEGREGLDRLEEAARSRPTAFFCAEAVPWRCHRSLVADALTARGWTVLDIVGPGEPGLHALPDFARVSENRVVYDAGPQGRLPLA
jgi:uncharacterized protein (DUF488 family)